MRRACWLVGEERCRFRWRFVSLVEGGMVDEGTYKKNFSSPLITAFNRESLSEAFLGIGLQKAKGSSLLWTVR